MKIEIAERDFREMSGTSKAGKAYSMAFQDAYFHGTGRYPEKFELPLQKNESGQFVPYEPGFYVPSALSYQVRDGRFGINGFELTLVPYVETPKVKAA